MGMYVNPTTLLERRFRNITQLQISQNFWVRLNFFWGICDVPNLEQ